MNLSKILFILATLFFVNEGCKPPKGLEQNSDNIKYGGDKFNEHIRSSEARSPEEERLGFSLPPGFQIQLFASEPDIGKPINMAFDAKGRLWVTQSFEYPFAAAPGTGKDRITILEDTDGDGKADLFTIFQDTLNIPIGILPIHGGVVAYSIPYVQRFFDANNDGKPEKKKNILGPFGYKDTHGMVNNLARGYDGWIHSGHGFTNTSTVAGTDGDSIKMVSGNTFRFKPDGSRVEQTTFGRINPFGLSFDELGYLYSTDCYTSPLYQLIRGGDYSQWGKVPDIGFAPVMKPLEDEATALAGLAYYADTKFPEEYRSNFYIGDVVRCRIYRNSHTFNGSSPVGKKEADFVLSEDPWFRPVDVKMGPDGALYIADFYNSIIGHYEVPLDHPKRDKVRGRIWRITYKGESNITINLAAATVKEFLSALDEENLFLRMTATDQLVDRFGHAAVEPVKAIIEKRESCSRKYIHCLWVLQRLNALSDDLLIISAHHKDPLIRLHTMHILAEMEDKSQTYYTHAITALSDTDPHVKRAAVELLIKYPTINSLEYALSTLHEAPDYDSHLVYTTRLILRNLLRNKQLFDKVIAKEWQKEDAVYLADVLVGVPSSESAFFLLNYIEKYSLPKGNLEITFQHIARYIPLNKVDESIKIARLVKSDEISTEFQIFKGLRTGFEQKGEIENIQLDEWGVNLAKKLLNEYPPVNLMENSNEVLLRQKFAVELAGNYKIHSLESLVRSFIEEHSDLNIKNPDWDTYVKLQAVLDLKTSSLRALLQIAPETGVELVGQLIHDEEFPMELRKRAAEVLGEAPGPAVNKVLGSVKNMPFDMQIAIATSLATSPEGINILFQKVRKGEIFPRVLLQPKVEELILMNHSQTQQQEFLELVDNLDPISKEKEMLIYSRLLAYNEATKNYATLQQQKALESGKKLFLMNCSSCHRIGNQGGSIGPNLDGIGGWGVNALVEKVLDPNRNISEAFKNYTIRLKDGKIMNGLYRRDEGEVIIFADLTGEEFTISKKNIAERKASKYTLMPDHFGNTLSQDEVNSLITYLLSLKG
ncbi:hypothetical protein BH23BAC1_BH23BAC1_22010 [soil metagenome]